MREILYRGKRRDGKGWDEGNLSCYPNWNRVFIHTNDPRADGCVEVDKKTVGQFTGLLDKDGKRIFEGDIVSTDKYGRIYKGYNVKGEDTFCVVYRPALFRLERENPPRGFNLVDDGFSKMEVIGNIHDNPELLGGNEGG